MILFRCPRCRTVPYNQVSSCNQVFRMLIAILIAIVIEQGTTTCVMGQWVGCYVEQNTGDEFTICGWGGGSPLRLMNGDDFITLGSESYIFSVCTSSAFSTSTCDCTIWVNPNAIITSFPGEGIFGLDFILGYEYDPNEACTNCNFESITSDSYSLSAYDCSNRLIGSCVGFSTDAGCISNEDIAPTDPPIVNPTIFPINPPTTRPTALPINPPTTRPTDLLINPPTTRPTDLPINPPSTRPTDLPVNLPTANPTTIPINPPTANPSISRINNPTDIPTNRPSEIENQPSTSQSQNGPALSSSSTLGFDANNPIGLFNIGLVLVATVTIHSFI